MWSYLVAVVLLVGDPDSAHEVDSEIFHQVNFAMKDIAVKWEILDERERNHVLCHPRDFHNDLELLRQRNKDLHDAPSFQDTIRFPDSATIGDCLSFNRAYRQQINAMIPGMPSKFWEYNAILREVDDLYQIWEYLSDVQCSHYYVTVRRTALKNLRERIGYDDYYSGKLPPWVPLWRFQEIR